jgi:hypothetical protein
MLAVLWTRDALRGAQFHDHTKVEGRVEGGNEGDLHSCDASQRRPLGREGAGELIVIQQSAPLEEIRPRER